MSNKNPIKVYFGEILRELFDVGTPTHYKAQISNPKTLLLELQNYLITTEGTIYTQFDHVKCILEEYLYKVQKDIVFKKYINEFNYFHTFIKDEILLQKQQKENKENYLLEELKNRMNPIVRYLNKTYLSETKKLILDALDKSNSKIEPKDFKTVKQLCLSLSTELLRLGYSKYYIYDQIISLLFYQDDSERKFIENFDQEIKKHTVVIKIYTKNQEIKDIFMGHFGRESIFSKLPEKIINDAQNNNSKEFTGDTVERFLKESPADSFWIKRDVESVDYVNATRLLVKDIHILFDEVKFEYTSTYISIFHHGLCFDEDNKAHFTLVAENIYVYRKNSSSKYFSSRNQQVQGIYSSTIIQESTKEKLQTLFRFYRYFLESDTLEHKFLNLWIGWEHVFSLNLKQDSQTWKNIYSFFPQIYSIGSIERILRDLIQAQFCRKASHNSEKNKIKESLDGLLGRDMKLQSSSLYQIIKEKTAGWDNLIGQDWLKNDDLTRVKLFRLHEKFKSPRKYIENYNNKVRWSLFRLYRVRNAIVHKGNIKTLGLPIEELTSELEHYYKIFIDIVIERFSKNERFDNFEQLFLSFQKTYYSYINEDGISKIAEIAEVKAKIVNRPLVF